MKFSRIVIALLVLARSSAAIDMPLSKAWLNSPINQRKLPPLGDPLREGMMAEVRMAQTNRALQIQYGGLHVLLGIELGDEQLLQSLVGDKFIHRSGGASRDSTDLLMQATEPSVIAAVAPYLSRDEPTKGILLEDYEITRLSVAATMIVLSVAKSSDRLPPEVQQWAREVYYAPFNRNSSREAVRAF